MYFSEKGNVDDNSTLITIFLVSFNLQSCCLMQSAVCKCHTPLSNTLRDAKVPNCGRMFSYSAHFLSQVRHYKANSSRRFERELFLDVTLTAQSLDVDAMFQSRRSQEQKLTIERPLLLKIG